MVFKDWEKKGLIFRPTGAQDWAVTHGMVPAPLQLDGSHYRIYCASRNRDNQSSIGFIEVDLRQPERVLRVSEEPVLKPGKLGCFDDNGVLPSCAVRLDGQTVYLYYIGFKPGGTTRMDLFGGLAISTDGGLSFQRYSQAPVLDRCRTNPYINTAPWACRISETEWVLYYVSGVEWVHRDLPRYNIQRATSADGIHWDRPGQVAIDFADGEDALARPYVWRLADGSWRMLFSSKGETYRTQSAVSPDGITWTREPRGEWFESSETGPDSGMVAYPALLSWEGTDAVYYNGNDYGKDGICLAVRKAITR